MGVFCNVLFASKLYVKNSLKWMHQDQDLDYAYSFGLDSFSPLFLTILLSDI